MMVWLRTGAVLFLLALLRAVLDRIAKDLVTRHLVRARAELRRFFFAVFLVRSRPTPLATSVARRARRWLATIPGINPGALDVLDPDTHGHGAREVLLIATSMLWGAYTTARRHDRTLQLGMWLRLVGITTGVLGLLAALNGQPWALEDLAFGFALTLVGHYLTALRHRRVLSLAMVPVGPVAVWLAMRFQVPVPPNSVGWVVQSSLRLGSILAGLASLTVILQTAGKRFHPQGRRSRRLVMRIRLGSIRLGMLSCFGACIAYAISNLLQAFTIAPSLAMQATHLLITAFLLLVASESRHRPRAYRRLVVA